MVSIDSIGSVELQCFVHINTDVQQIAADLKYSYVKGLFSYTPCMCQIAAKMLYMHRQDKNEEFEKKVKSSFKVIQSKRLAFLKLMGISANFCN